MAISFKRKSSTIARSLLAAGLIASLAACEKPDTQATKAGSATFLVDSASGYGEIVQNDPNSKWKVPSSVLFSFQACLKDRASGETMRGHTFNVERAEDGVQFTPDEPSDIKGCIKWSEDIAFNYFAKKSSRLPITRYVVGQGINSGKAEVKLVINPWAVGGNSRDRGDAVVFLRDQILPKGQVASALQVQSALSGDLSGKAGLWISNININSIRRQSYSDGSVVDLEFSVKPKIVMTDMNGEESYRSIDSGEFDIIAHLIATDTGTTQKEKLLLTTSEISGTGRLRDGELVINTRTSLERRVSLGNLQVALKLIPRGLGSLSALKNYEGIFELGDYNALSRGPGGTLSELCRRDDAGSECTVAQALASTSNYEALAKQGFAHKNDSLIFSNLRLRFASVQPGETATQRTVLYAASTCITDRWSGSSMNDTPFQIDYLDEKGSPIKGMSQSRSTNETGCLNWDSTIFHKYYQPERLIWHEVRISFGNGRVARNLKFAINPWDDKFTFGWDAREFSEKFIETVQNRKKIPSRFFLSNYGYHTVRFLYNIDKFMELEVKKTVLVELDPVVLRYSGIVNARKQTESLRDGIYLLKVGIQKDYLDPADRSHKIENKRDSIAPADIPEMGGDVSRKEYVTTQSQLVRVVDGKINHPVELTMRDLRLMRIRANFMIQLETVDERKVTAVDVLRNKFKSDLEDIKRQDLSALPVEERETKMKEQALERKGKIEAAFFMLQNKLDSIGTSMSEMDLTMDKDIKEPLEEALDTNDFTGTKFVLSEDFDLDQFLEKDSGLERRTFVGPVIFLSNAFSDAVRATDNLDEACRHENQQKQEPDDEGMAFVDASKVRSEADEKSVYKLDELKLFVDAEKVKTDGRANNAYRFSKYYGSLSHLCSQHVDKLIKREKVLNKFYKENMPIYSSIYNFVSLYDLEFLTLGQEKLQKLDMNCRADSGNCLHPTEELTMPLANAVELVNFNRQQRMASASNRVALQEKNTDYSTDEVGGILFGQLDNVHTQYGLCSILAGRAAERLDATSKDERYAGFFTRMHGNLLGSKERMAETMFERCIKEMQTENKPVFIEERLRVLETGKYTFLGGLQMNLNVATATSVSRGESWSYGFEPIDVLSGPLTVGGALLGGMVGGPPGAAVGASIGILAGPVSSVLKPISLKYGTSMGNSDGTNISLSTYLVGQIARFNLQVDQYESCRVIRFDPQFAIDASNELGLNPKQQEKLSRGLFVCSGQTSDKPTSVEESYFYFTQHFTEGDMLDQADIYNHPWLLGLRGVREFATLLDVTNAQEVVNLQNMHQGFFKPEKRALGWPLTHLATTYRKMLPTFPGLYTVVKDDEKMTTYPVSGRFSTVDKDINGEVRCKLDKKGSCEEKENIPDSMQPDNAGTEPASGKW